MKKNILVLLMGLLSTNLFAREFRSYINLYIDPVTFQGDRGNTVSMYAISGLEADQSGYHVIIKDNLAGFEKRKEAYTRTLQRFAFQEEFMVIDELETLKSSGLRDNEALYNYLRRFAEQTGLGVDFVQFVYNSWYILLFLN